MKLVHQVTCVLFILLAAFVANRSMKQVLYAVGTRPWLLSLLDFNSDRATGRRETVTGYSLGNGSGTCGFLPFRAGYLRIIAIIVAVAGTVLLMEPLGFRLTMLVFLLLLAALGRVNQLSRL